MWGGEDGEGRRGKREFVGLIEEYGGIMRVIVRYRVRVSFYRVFLVVAWNAVWREVIIIEGFMF